MVESKLNTVNLIAYLNFKIPHTRVLDARDVSGWWTSENAKAYIFSLNNINFFVAQEAQYPFEWSLSCSVGIIFMFIRPFNYGAVYYTSSGSPRKQQTGKGKEKTLPAGFL